MSKRVIRNIACVGEVMIELIAQDNGQASLGVAGDTYNTAVYLARKLKGSGKSVSYVTALGTDPYSDRIIRTIENHGIRTGHIERRAELLPGLYAIDTDDHGERSFSYWRSNSAARTLFAEPCAISLASLDQFDLLFLSGITMAILPADIRVGLIEWIDNFRSNGGTIAYDSNHRPKLWENVDVARQTNAAMWARTDIALPSVDDEMLLFGDLNSSAVVARLRKLGVRRGALKQGAEGPLDLSDQRVLTGLPVVDHVVDTTAAGDSFNAGYLSAVALGLDEQTAAETGHQLAARVIQHPGAIIPEQAMI